MNTLKEVFEDEHFKKRDALLSVSHPRLGEVTQVGISPKLSGTPGAVRWSGHECGQDTVQILKDELGYDDAQIETLIAGEIAFSAPVEEEVLP